MVALYRKYRDQGFTVLAVNASDEDVKAVKRFAKTYDIPYPLLMNGRRLREDWGVQGIPANFFVDREGKMVKRFGSFDDRNVERVARTIERLLH